MLTINHTPICRSVCCTQFYIDNVTTRWYGLNPGSSYKTYIIAQILSQFSLKLWDNLPYVSPFRLQHVYCICLIQCWSVSQVPTVGIYDYLIIMFCWEPYEKRPLAKHMKLIIALGNFSCLVEQVVKGLNLLQEPLRQEEVYSEKCTKMPTCSVMSLYSLQAKFPLDHDLHQWSKDGARYNFQVQVMSNRTGIWSGQITP